MFSKAVVIFSKAVEGSNY